MAAAARKPDAARARHVNPSARLSLPGRIGFSVAVFVGLLLIVELLLRIGGVTFHPTAITLTHDVGREIAEVQLARDGQVQWIVKPDTLSGTPLAVNAHGMRGPDLPVDKPPGVIRVLCLGDSCTFGARCERPYPVILEALGRARFGDTIEVLNGGVPGHAAHQGLAMLDRYLKFAPDIVTVYFGWNDHWNRRSALAGPDLPSPPVTDHVRVLRGLRMAYRRMAARRYVLKEENVVEIAESRLRLPPMHYRAMLDEFAVYGRRYGFDVVFLTAPSALTGESLQQILRNGWANHAEDVIELHDHYNDICREMAAKWRATLVDLVRIFDDRPDETLLHWDGIHLSQEGHTLVAESVFAAIAPILEARLARSVGG